MKNITIGILATVIAASSALAGEEVMSKDYKQPVAIPCFKDQEFQLDIFGSFMNFPYGSDSEHHHDRDRDGGGGGVGANYFFMRYIGIGVDGDFDSNRGGVANYTGKLIFRFPIETGRFCIAPYIFGGGGGESLFDDDFDDSGHHHHHHDGNGTVGAWMAGGGIEWRLTPRFGIFAEGRFTWTGEDGRDGYNDEARLGLRVAF
jgi:opacity protein-like surface antigen